MLDNISLTSFLFMMVRNSCLNYLKHRQIADTVQQRIPDTETAERLYAVDFVPDPSSSQMQGSVRSQPSEWLEKPGDSGTYGYYGESGGETHYPCLETIPGWIKTLCLITGNAPQSLEMVIKI